MRVSYDPEADAAYIYLTDDVLMPGRDSVACEAPEGEQAIVVLDWKDGKIVGLEVLDASARLHPDLLSEAPQRQFVQQPTAPAFLLGAEAARGHT